MNCARAILFITLGGLLSATVTAAAEPSIPAYVSAAVADPSRPKEQTAHDASRRPAEVIVFAGLKPGDSIADFMPGSGYFSRIFSRVVGPSGRVYTFTPTEQIKNCDADESAGGLALAKDTAYPNIKGVIASANDFKTPTQVDVVWTAQNFHDFYDPFMGPTNIETFTRAVFRSVKPGGEFIVIDHVAEAGSGVRDTNTLHRIDSAIIKQVVVAAGFAFESESDVLRNPSDTHKLRVFDPAIRGRTDQIVYKFRKPLTPGRKI